MSLYYLMSQLPSLDGVSDSTPIPITEERFYELCESLADKRLFSIIKSLSLVPEKDGKELGNPLIDAWNKNERGLRMALSAVRAEKLKKPSSAAASEFMHIAREAVEKSSPLDAELFLMNIRESFLESLRPMDEFSESALIYYGLKLKLLLRIRRFETEKGKTAYRNIYASILGGDEQEA